MIDLSMFERRQVRCAGVGELLFDIYADSAHLGGAPANFAYHCQQNGLQALIISAIGHDELGLQARLTLAQKFMPNLLFEVPRATGSVEVTLHGELPGYAFAQDCAYDHLPLTTGLLELAKELDVVCFGTLAQRSQAAQHTILSFLDALPQQALKIFDVNLRGDFFSPEIIEASLQRTTLLKCNETELPVLCEIAGVPSQLPAYHAYLRQRGIDGLIYTSGPEQSTIYYNDMTSTLTSPRVRAVDTVGAGDAFLASLLSALLKNMTLEGAHSLAADYAAYVCTQPGGMPAIPRSLTA